MIKIFPKMREGLTIKDELILHMKDDYLLNKSNRKPEEYCIKDSRDKVKLFLSNKIPYEISDIIA